MRFEKGHEKAYLDDDSVLCFDGVLKNIGFSVFVISD